MSIFNIPSKKNVNKIIQETTILSENLLKIIDKYNWSEKYNNTEFSSQVIVYFFILEIYRQLLTTKHKNKYCEIVCRAIIISFEEKYNLSNKELLNLFIQLQQKMNIAYSTNNFTGVTNILLEELGFTYSERESNKHLIEEISNFFDTIINTPFQYIL